MDEPEDTNSRARIPIGRSDPGTNVGGAGR